MSLALDGLLEFEYSQGAPGSSSWIARTRYEVAMN